MNRDGGFEIRCAECPEAFWVSLREYLAASAEGRPLRCSEQCEATAAAREDAELTRRAMEEELREERMED